jgi:alkylation response protein AidB-like acyl-CoA dehydrogenase
MQHVESVPERQFRAEVRAWLQANKPKDARPGDSDIAGQIAFDKAWQRKQYDGGWAGVHWPKEYGGRGLSPSQQIIWCEEYASAKCPLVHDSCWMAQNHAGPTIWVRGTPEQKAFHLPRILKGELTWCQGFSEPNAGSDLAGLRCRGVVDGDHLVVNGSKIWTSYAHLQDFQELLVRTGPADGRHRGLTWIICDMKTPGLEVRKIKALDGLYHNCECFYDNVRIPLTNVVGQLHDGWSVVLTTFQFERGPAAFSSFCQMAVSFEELVDYARAHPLPGETRPAIADTTIAERIGLLRARVQSLRSLMYMMTGASERNTDLGADGSIMHLPYTELEQDIFRLAVDILGPAGLRRSVQHEWMMAYFKSFSATIAGGTSEIQRNIIGERLLGLPR